MSGMPQEQRDQEPQRVPLSSFQGSFHYRNYERRRRNLRYIIVAALFILALGVGLIVTLIADSLPAKIF
jgi:hypothetical protein